MLRPYLPHTHRVQELSLRGWIESGGQIDIRQAQDLVGVIVEFNPFTHRIGNGLRIRHNFTDDDLPSPGLATHCPSTLLCEPWQASSTSPASHTLARLPAKTWHSVVGVTWVFPRQKGASGYGMREHIGRIGDSRPGRSDRVDTPGSALVIGASTSATSGSAARGCPELVNQGNLPQKGPRHPSPSHYNEGPSSSPSLGQRSTGYSPPSRHGKGSWLDDQVLNFWGVIARFKCTSREIDRHTSEVQ